MSHLDTPKRLMYRICLTAGWLAPALLLPALPAQGQGLTPGENTVSGRLEVVSQFRIGTEPSVNDVQYSDYFLEGSTFTAAGRALDSMVAGGPGSRGRGATSGWAVAGAAGVFVDALGAGVPNPQPDMLNNGHAVSEADASWWDSVRITSPQVPNGSSGRLTAHLTVSGTLSAEVSAFFSQSYAAFYVTGEGMVPVGGSSGGCASSAVYCTYTSAGGYNGWADGTREFGSRTIAVSLPFVFGDEFYLGYAVSAVARATGVSFTGNQTVAQGAAVAAFGNSVLWGGIDGIYRGSGGSLVTDYDITSASGTDFRFGVASPVPEVSPASLLLGGLPAICWLTRRRRPR